MDSVVVANNTTYDAVPAHDMALVFMGTGVVGTVLYLLILLSYLYVPMIKSQHPSADIVIWQVVAGLMASIGFVVSYANAPTARTGEAALFPLHTCEFLGLYSQFWILSSCMWYMMLTLDLFVALVNPWMGYACKAWAYHSIAWSLSAILTGLVYQQHGAGVSSLNICWIKRTQSAEDVNHLHWIALFGPIIGVAVVSLFVLFFASFRFVRRQLDVTYRSKRRVLLQYYRYLVIYSGFWAACGVLYFADYRQHFHGAMASRIQLAFAVVYGSYPLLLLVVWVLNTEVYQHRSRENTLTSAEREAEKIGKAEHFSVALRKDLMRYTTAGIRCSIDDEIIGKDLKDPSAHPSSMSPPMTRSRLDSIDSNTGYFSGDETAPGSPGLYSEKKRRATTVYNGEYRYYEKLGFTDYAPRIFENIRAACGIDDRQYEQSFAETLLERATEGKSGMLFYFTSDRKYLVKTMTKKEHSFLLDILPLYHQYILKQPNTLLCRFLGCHSMQLPVGWNRMFFVVMENVFADGPVNERYDLKGIFEETEIGTAGRRVEHSRHVEFRTVNDIVSDLGLEVDEGDGDGDDDEYGESTHSASSFADRYGYNGDGMRAETEPLLRRPSSRSSLRHDSDFVCRSTSLHVNATTRANLLAQITNDCGFLQHLGIMDYSFLLGVQNYDRRLDVGSLGHLAHNAVVSQDQTKVYYLGFIDILQHYNLGWKLQHWLLSVVLDRRKITALPPAEYALRFLSFIHAYMLCDPGRSTTRSYGSIDLSNPVL